jgi:hypothetical protein
MRLPSSTGLAPTPFRTSIGPCATRGISFSRESRKASSDETQRRNKATAASESEGWDGGAEGGSM